MSKRLEELKKKTTGKDYLWAIKYAKEQAERVRELERQNKALELEVDGWFNKANEIHESMLRQDKVIDKFRQQNKRYREALEYIADNKIEHGWNLKAVNCVVRARKALEGDLE